MDSSRDSANAPFVVPTSISERIRVGKELVAAAVEVPPKAGQFEASDAFAGVTGLPEVAVSGLDGQQVASGLLHHGALVVRGLLTDDHISWLRHLIDSGAERVALKSTDDDGMKARMVDAIVRVFAEVGVLRVAADYLGERPVGMTQRTVVKRNVRTRGLPWHQDASFFGAQISSLAIWVALTPCGSDRPGLSIIPRRINRVIDESHRSVHPNHVLLAAAEDFERTTAAATPVLAPGDAIVFDEMTLHRTSVCQWVADSRDVAILWLFAPSRFPAGWVPLALT